MADPPIAERHKPHFHRTAPMKEAVRVATTADITLSGRNTRGQALGLARIAGEWKGTLDHSGPDAGNIGSIFDKDGQVIV